MCFSNDWRPPVLYVYSRREIQNRLCTHYFARAFFNFFMQSLKLSIDWNLYLQSGWALHSSAKWWQAGVWWGGLASLVPSAGDDDAILPPIDVAPPPPDDAGGGGGGGKWYRSGRLAQSGWSLSCATRHSSFLLWLFLLTQFRPSAPRNKNKNPKKEIRKKIKMGNVTMEK